MTTPMRQIFPYGEHKHAKLIVPSLGVVRGESHGLSVIVPEGTPDGAVIETERFAEFFASGKVMWRNQGAIVQPVLERFTLDGWGEVSDSPNTWPADKDKPVRWNGIHVSASGATVRDVHIDNVPGTGLVTHRGYSIRSGRRDRHDAEVTRVMNCRIGRCLGDGWVIAGPHSDGVSFDVDIGSVRGDAFRSEESAGGWSHYALHCYQAPRGIVILGPGVYTSCQGETCGIGTVVGPKAAGTKLIGHKSFGNPQIGVHLQCQSEIVGGDLQASEGVAVLIDGTGCRVSGTLSLEGKATGVVVNSDKAKLDLTCWGGGTHMVLGDAKAVSECNITLNSDGCDGAVEIRQIGKHNTIRLVSHPGRQKWTVKLPANMDTSNKILEVKAA